MKFFPFVLKNLLRNQRRTLLTMLSMAASFFLFTALLSLVFVIYENPDKAMARHSISVNSKTGSLPLAYIKEIAGRFAASDPQRGLDGEALDRIAKEGLYQPETTTARVDAMMGFIYGGNARIGDTDNLVAIIDPVSVRDIWTNMREVDASYFDAFLKDRRTVLMGRSTADQFGFKAGQPIELMLTSAGGGLLTEPAKIPVTVAGFAPEGKWSNTTYMHRSYAEEFIKKSQVNMLFLNVRSKEDVEPVRQEIETMFANANPGVQTGIQAQFLRDMQAVVENLSKLIVVVVIVIVGTILLVAANSMAMGIRTRTSDVAVLKTLGFTRHQVLGLLLTESGLMGLVGGAIGCGAAYLLLSDMTFPMSPSEKFTIDPSAVWMGTLLAAVLGVASGWFPAVRASNNNILDALRKII